MVTVRVFVFVLFLAVVVGKSLKNSKSRLSAIGPSWYQSVRLPHDVMPEDIQNMTLLPRRIRRQVIIDGIRRIKDLPECTPPKRRPGPLRTGRQCYDAVYVCTVGSKSFKEIDCSLSSACMHSCQPVYNIVHIPNKNGCFLQTGNCKCGSTFTFESVDKKCGNS